MAGKSKGKGKGKSQGKGKGGKGNAEMWLRSRESEEQSKEDSDQPGTSQNNVTNSQEQSTTATVSKSHEDTNGYDADDERDQRNMDSGKMKENQAPNIAELEKIETACCMEKMPSFDSESPISHCDPSEFESAENSVLKCNCIDPTNLPFYKLLELHKTQMCSSFEFGEVTKRCAQENMRCGGRHRNDETVSKIKEKTCTDLAGCSKMSSVPQHKTPHSQKRKRSSGSLSDRLNTDEFRKNNRAIPEMLRNHPECVEVWNYMVYKEEVALKLRNPRVFLDFKTVTARMRAILLDWLMEVSDVYHLKRVTYYLSIDYFDRVLSIRPDIPKSLLQLVGITCLYIAAKIEEIYPPNLSEFSYVCDGACQAQEVVACEILILNSLGWEVMVSTPSDWLNLYMQLHHKTQEAIRSNLSLTSTCDFIFPQYSAYQFIRASQLMDLLSLDPCFLKFGYSVVAASAMYFMYGEDVAIKVSGLTWAQLKPCIDYMKAFHDIIQDANDPRLTSCLGEEYFGLSSKTATDYSVNGSQRNENYSIQSHIANIEYFEQATTKRHSDMGLAKLKVTEENSKEEDPSKEDIENTGNEGEEEQSNSSVSLDEMIFDILYKQEELELLLNDSS